MTISCGSRDAPEIVLLPLATFFKNASNPAGSCAIKCVAFLAIQRPGTLL